LRQAHRVALRTGGFRAAPGWIVGGLIGAAFLSATLVAGSTDRAPAAPGRSIDASLGALTAQTAAAPLIRTVSPVGAVWVETSGNVPPGASPARDLLPAMSGSAVASATSHPKATPHSTTAARLKAVPRPKATPRATATPARTSVPRATAAPKLKAPAPKPKATVPKPTPAIVYPHRATGWATWGEFGGAVVTRLPQRTRIRVCGRFGCWAGVSTGYGPTASGGNLVDLDAAVFRRICGPLGAGVGAIVLSWR